MNDRYFENDQDEEELKKSKDAKEMKQDPEIKVKVNTNAKDILMSSFILVFNQLCHRWNLSDEDIAWELYEEVKVIVDLKAKILIPSPELITKINTFFETTLPEISSEKRCQKMELYLKGKLQQ